VKKITAFVALQLFVMCPECESTFDIITEPGEEVGVNTWELALKCLNSGRIEGPNIVKKCPACGIEMMIEQIVY